MQSKRESFIETITNVFIGFMTTLILSPPIYWICGVEMRIGQVGAVTALFTLVSVIRGYIVRRFFNKQDKDLVVTGTLVEFDKVNKNGRIYPEDVYLTDDEMRAGKQGLWLAPFEIKTTVEHTREIDPKYLKKPVQSNYWTEITHLTHVKDKTRNNN